MTNKFEALAAYARWESSDLADPEVTKHYDNRARFAVLVQELDGPFDNRRVDSLIAANENKFILDANAYGEKKMQEQTQEELLVELTVSSLNHWAAAGKKPANLLATE